MITVLGRGLLAIMLVSVNFGLHAQTLDQQEKCATLARKAFNEEEASFAAVLKSGLVPNYYQGHYNRKLDKCFMVVNRFTSYEGKRRKTACLSDAIEKRLYAYYQEIEGKKEPDCTLYPSSTKVTYCKARVDFDEFVAGYME